MGVLGTSGFGVAVTGNCNVTTNIVALIIVILRISILLIGGSGSSRKSSIMRHPLRWGDFVFCVAAVSIACVVFVRLQFVP